MYKYVDMWGYIGMSGKTYNRGNPGEGKGK